MPPTASLQETEERIHREDRAARLIDEIAADLEDTRPIDSTLLNGENATIDQAEAESMDVSPSTTPPASIQPMGSAEEQVLNPHRWIILVALVLAAILELLDTTSVTVAVPQMMGNLGATPDEIGWVSTSYILSNVIVLPMTAWLASFFGRKRYLVSSILIFTTASFLCGTAGSLGALVFWRILQGVGGAALISTAQSTLVEIFPRKQVPLVQSLFAFGLIVAPTLGPTFGGWMVDNYSWPWIFFAKSPLGLVAAFLVWRFLHDSPGAPAAKRIDIYGIGMMAIGLGSLQYVLEEGNRYDWFDDSTITRLTFVAIIALVGFVVWELHPTNQSPVVDLRVLKERSLMAGTLLQTVLGFGLIGATFVIPMFTQNVLGFTPTESGMVLLPGGIFMAISALSSGQFLQRGMDPRVLVGIGIPINIGCMWMLGHLAPDSGYNDVCFGLILRGLGSGLLFTPLVVSAFGGLRGPQIAQGAAMMNLCRQLGGSISIAFLSTYVERMNAYHRAVLTSPLGPYNTMMRERAGAISSGLVEHGYSLPTAHAAAMGIIDHAVQIQSAVQSYDDTFLFVGIIFLVTSPLILILRKPGGAAAAAKVDAH